MSGSESTRYDGKFLTFFISFLVLNFAKIVSYSAAYVQQFSVYCTICKNKPEILPNTYTDLFTTTQVHIAPKPCNIYTMYIWCWLPKKKLEIRLRIFSQVEHSKSMFTDLLMMTNHFNCLLFNYINDIFRSNKHDIKKSRKFIAMTLFVYTKPPPGIRCFCACSHKRTPILFSTSSRNFSGYKIHVINVNKCKK